MYSKVLKDEKEQIDIINFLIKGLNIEKGFYKLNGWKYENEYRYMIELDKQLLEAIEHLKENKDDERIDIGINYKDLGIELKQVIAGSSSGYEKLEEFIIDNDIDISKSTYLNKYEYISAKYVDVKNDKSVQVSEKKLEKGKSYDIHDIERYNYMLLL